MSTLRELQDEIGARVFVRANDSLRITRANLFNPSEVPWLFDFRAIMLEPKWLNTYAEIFWEKHAHLYPFQVGGMETAAIPLVSAIVMKGMERKTPVNGFFIRKSRKREGLMKVIEGTVTNDSIILVDDLINSGSSFLKQILILKDIGARVTDVFAMLAFRPPETYASAKEENINIRWLFTLEDFGLPLEGTLPLPKRNGFEIAWRWGAPSPSFEHVVQKSAPVVDEKNVYVGSDAGTFFSLRQTDGSVAWSFDTEKHPKGKGIFSSPVLNAGSVYFGAYDGNVYSLNAATGAMQWKYSDADWVGSSPALAPEKGLLYIGLEFGLFRKRGGIAAIDTKTGKARWTARMPELTHGSPLYIAQENLVVIGSNDGVLYAYDALTGKEKWRFGSGADIKSQPAYDPKNRLILVPSLDSTLYALSARNGQAMWAFQTGSGIYSIPLVHENTAYVASLDKSLYAIDLENGHMRGEFATNGRIFASPVLADDSLWIGSNDGKLYELDIATLKQKGFHQFSERIVNKIAYNSKSKKLFVPTVANELYCLKRK